MVTQIGIGLGNPVFESNVKRMGGDIDAYECYCSSGSHKIKRLREDFALFSHLSARPNGDQERVLSEFIGAITDADIQLSPRECALQTQISRLATLLNESGSDPKLLEKCDEMREKVTSSATTLRNQRDAGKRELAPRNGWSLRDWSNGYSSTHLNSLRCQATTKPCYVIELSSEPCAVPKLPSNDN